MLIVTLFFLLSLSTGSVYSQNKKAVGTSGKRTSVTSADAFLDRFEKFTDNVLLKAKTPEAVAKKPELEMLAAAKANYYGSLNDAQMKRYKKVQEKGTRAITDLDLFSSDIAILFHQQISIADVKSDEGEAYQIEKVTIEESSYGIDIAERVKEPLVMMESQKDKPFVMVEQMPQFTGGDTAMQAFIKENLST